MLEWEEGLLLDPFLVFSVLSITKLLQSISEPFSIDFVEFVTCFNRANFLEK